MLPTEAPEPKKKKSLTQTTLETLTIIAYKQPVTRMDLEEIRGNSEYALQKLLELKVIEPVGRKDAVGKPALFGTTDEFLKRFNISKIDELPDYNALLENIQKIRENYSDSLFNHFEPGVQQEEDIDRKLEELSKVETQKQEEDL